MNDTLPEILTPDLLKYLRSSYQLKWSGMHGWDHWMRVYENGMHIARQNGADLTVVGLFAFTHDIDRLRDHGDPDHGPRAAQRIQREMQGRFFHLTNLQLDELIEAVRLHTAGQTEASITVQTCWDADRLDLWRAGIRPNPRYLCTSQAKLPQTIQWAVERSQAWLDNRS